jgi:RNA polymerase subunit RPABC4/transcription elongation factor Spt4
MALTPCPDCKTQVSTESEKCPKCGRPIKPKQTATGILAAIVIGGVVGFLGLKLLGYL